MNVQKTIHIRKVYPEHLITQQLFLDYIKEENGTRKPHFPLGDFFFVRSEKTNLGNVIGLRKNLLQNNWSIHPFDNYVTHTFWSLSLGLISKLRKVSGSRFMRARLPGQMT